MFSSNVTYLGASRVDPVVFEDAVNALQDVFIKFIPDENVSIGDHYTSIVGHSVRAQLTYSGLEISYLDGNQVRLFLPLKYLIYCGAFRKVTPVSPDNSNGKYLSFKTLNQISPSDKAMDPVLVAVVFKGIGNFIAHVLAIDDNYHALKLVNTMMQCYYSKEYLAMHDDNLFKPELTNTTFLSDPNSSAFKPNFSLFPSAANTNIGDNENIKQQSATTPFSLPKKTIVPNENAKFIEHDGYLMDDSVSHQQPNVMASRNPYQTPEINNYLSNHFNPNGIKETSGYFTAVANNDTMTSAAFRQQTLPPMTALENIKFLRQPQQPGIIGDVMHEPAAQHVNDKDIFKQFRITYADGQEITQADISSDPNLRNTLRSLESIDINIAKGLGLNQETNHPVNDEDDYHQQQKYKESFKNYHDIVGNPSHNLNKQQQHNYYNHDHNSHQYSQSPKQNVIVRWLKPSDNHNTANPVVVEEQIRQVNPKDVNTIINEEMHPSINQSNGIKMEGMHCPSHTVHESPQTVIIERWLPPPAALQAHHHVCINKKDKPSKLLIPITVNETKYVKPNPVLIEHMQPIFRTRRRVIESHKMPICTRRC
ncbi:hypothetical protein GJ496_000261 [Pomphorhynchus laevis]|nr:hypothetical protein GJ496_006918 [Pomphorhynchus laevis]KAI0990148.1 hypothetical protein GJ496_000261 [Pomphorhynchus laevis]